jgi:hypothetical protein
MPLADDSGYEERGGVQGVFAWLIDRHSEERHFKTSDSGYRTLTAATISTNCSPKCERGIFTTRNLDRLALTPDVSATRLLLKSVQKEIGLRYWFQEM